jgi:uncharacterized membrane protein
MIVAMFLAHLVGDFILQWDRLAQWKSRELQGVLVHGLIVTVVTWVFAIPFAPGWWQGILFIGIAHTTIDAAQWLYTLPGSPLIRFLSDQFLHLLVILIALAAGGYLNLTTPGDDILFGIQHNYFLVYLLGYAFLTMPAWVLLKFLGYALVERTGPSFLDGSRKYIGIVERVLVATFVLMGQFILIPLVAIPRLVLEWRQISNKDRRTLYLFELFTGVSLAVGVGLLLRQL